MRYIKTYESKNKPDLYDYVICETRIAREQDLQEFLRNNIGLIVVASTSDTRYHVRYYNLPNHLLNYCINTENTDIDFDFDEIVKWSKNKEDLEIYITADKYNL
jgi:hypothetical protein